jgi:amidase
MLSAIAGPDSRAPLSITEPGDAFFQLLERDFKGVRVAWSTDLGGLPVDSPVIMALGEQRSVFDSLGCAVEYGELDFAGADEAFKVWRAWYYELSFGGLFEEHHDKLKDTVVQEIEAGRRISGPQLGEAERKRTELYHRMRTFMERYEFLILPVTQVSPFNVKQRYVTEINGVKLKTYIDWMRSCYYITVTGLPAISVPCGFTPEGLPVGVQIVGRYRDDLGVLQLAHAFEQETGFWKRRPPVVE